MLYQVQHAAHGLGALDFPYTKRLKGIVYITRNALSVVEYDLHRDRAHERLVSPKRLVDGHPPQTGAARLIA